MKKLLAVFAALLPLAACQTSSMFNPDGAKAEFASVNGGPVSKPVFANALKLCNERFTGLANTEYALYGPYGEWTDLIDDAKGCMRRHGVIVKGFRQRDGRLTAYPISPKYLDY